MNLDNNVGDVYLRINAVGAGCCPAIEAILPPGADAERAIAALNEDISAALAKHLGNYEVVLAESFGVRLQHSRVIGTPEEERRRREEAFDRLGDLLPKQDENAQATWDEEVKNHPQNGKLGWWLVEDYRHAKYVRAASVSEALEKADLIMAEMPQWVGEELPDVIEV